jgi:WW domain-containing oxidoreductase
MSKPFGRKSTAEEVTAGVDLTGKSAVITGTGSGLGQETARVLALRGAHVIALDRAACELANPNSVRAAADRILAMKRPIDMLICNAGIMALPRLQQTHGYETQFFVNHIGHFILVNRLLPALSDTARVVMLSSYGHNITYKDGIQFENLSGDNGYSKWRAYGQSKLANLLTAVGLARRFEGTQKTANAVHPGVIRTPLSRHMSGFLNALYGATAPLFTKSIAQGAATTCYVAAHPDVAAISGKYFADCRIARPSAHGADPELAERLWRKSEEIAASV